MPRKPLLSLVIASAIMLSACSATAEEQIADGLEGAREAFEQEPLEANKTAEEISLYVPGGYTVENPEDENNVIITKDAESYVLFINPNEPADSRVFYDLQKSDPEEEFVVDETFEEDGRFGFATVREVGDGRFEVVVSEGGVKMTAMSAEAEIGRNIEWMMKTVRSVHFQG